jgi:HlyD family secretion protein
MKKIILIAVVVLVALGAGLRYLASVRGTNKEGTYQFVEVTRGNLEDVVSSTGSLEAAGTVEIGTQVSGTIDRIEVDFNDVVHNGQVLAVLDTALLKIAVLDAGAGLARVQAQYEQAQAEYNRSLSLFEKGYLSEGEFLPIRTSAKVSQAALQSAEVAMQRAERNLKYAIIRSPIDGTVIQRSVEPGQTVAASFSTPTLFVIAEDLSRMEIHATVDESDIGRIRKGQSARFMVEAYPDETFYGTVRQIRLQPVTVQNVVNYTVIVDASDKKGVLLPGMTATVDFVIEERKDVLLVPNAALRFQPTEEMMAELRRSGRERVQERSAVLPDSAKQLAQQSRARQGGIRGERGTSMPSQSGAQGDMARLWVLDENGKLGVIPVRKGATDGSKTEVAMVLPPSGEPGSTAPGPSRVHLREGMQVISGLTKQKQQSANADRGPAPPFGRRLF